LSERQYIFIGPFSSILRALFLYNYSTILSGYLSIQLFGFDNFFFIINNIVWIVLAIYKGIIFRRAIIYIWKF